MTRLRKLVGVPLILIVAFAAVAMASVRGRTNDGLTMTICSGTTVIIVTVGLDGEPVEKREICPDYGLILFCSTAADAPCAQPAQVRVHLVHVALVGARGHEWPRGSVRVRGPPLA